MPSQYADWGAVIAKYSLGLLADYQTWILAIEEYGETEHTDPGTLFGSNDGRLS